MVNPVIFKAYDVRGKVGSELTPEIVEKIGRAFADWLPTEGPVAVGLDMRPDSAGLATALIQGLTKQGRDVWDIGQITSEMVYFAAGKFGLAGGAVVTASHNPGKDNGIKFCADEAKAVGLESGLADIRELVLQEKFSQARRQSSVNKKDITKDWISHVMSFVDIQKIKPLKIAVDAGNGMAGKIFPELERHLPIETTEMYFELDGSFPNHEANPMKPETLQNIISVIKEKKLDAGVAFDADGDRAILIDEQGQIVTGPLMSSILAEYFMQKFPGGSVVYDVRNSKSVPELIEKLGGKPVLCRVGHTPIKEMMRKSDAVFGAEASGHFYFRDNWYTDSGLIAVLISLFVLSVSGKPLSELRRKYKKYEMIPETNYEVQDKEAVINELEKIFADKKQERVDGITVRFENGSWFNVRPSNTEPLLRLNAEANNQAELDSLVTKIKKIITSS